MTKISDLLRTLEEFGVTTSNITINGKLRAPGIRDVYESIEEIKRELSVFFGWRSPVLRKANAAIKAFKSAEKIWHQQNHNNFMREKRNAVTKLKEFQKAVTNCKNALSAIE